MLRPRTCALRQTDLFFADHFKTQEICIKAIEKTSLHLEIVLEKYNTQEICDKAVRKIPCLLKEVPI